MHLLRGNGIKDSGWSGLLDRPMLGNSLSS